MFTSDLDVREVGRLDVANAGWARVDLGDLDGQDPRLILAGQARVEGFVGKADAGKVGDLVPTYWAALFLVSAAFVQVLTEARLTGWSASRASVVGNPHAGDLMVLQVTGVCTAPRALAVGRELDPRGWDGSDLFLVDGDATIYLSPKARRVLISAALRNVETDLAGFEAPP